MVNTLENIREKIENRKTRSAWDRGVNLYALEILEEVAERAAYEGAEPADREQLIDYMLNGAGSHLRNGGLFARWSEYSYGGCSLICDGDIAARVCNPSEFKRFRGGDRYPSDNLTWLDVQARALFQAGNLILKAFNA